MAFLTVYVESEVLNRAFDSSSGDNHALFYTFQQSNQHLENVDGEDLLRKVVGLLRRAPLELADCSFEVEPAGCGAVAACGKGVLRVTSRTHGYPLRVLVPMTQGSELQFFEAVTRPLLKSVADLSKSERELSTLLCDKDREIGEYKEEGGQLFLKYLKTAPFDVTRHRATHAAHREAFGDHDATAALIDVALRAAAAAYPIIAKPEVKVENVKPEVISQAGNGSGSGLGVGNIPKSEVKREPPATSQRSPPKRMKKKFLNL